ncbi:MAG: hypothetical protein KatS3mg114_0166 [Planctomycetaceae bacterium]|nr:MAG: hypothetical protein KatS3mg114_0166 [Planctomycetaceae bacterium]
MHDDKANEFRPLLEEDPPSFLDRVNTPWDQVPDLEEYNQHAYKRIVRALKELSRTKASGGQSNSQGILVLGEAGTGKTHLLMRVAKNLSKSNHILFVRKPNNEDAVAQHIWFNVVSSLTRSLPESGTKRSQLDDLLAHVFTAVLIPEFEQDIQEGKEADQKRRWVERLRSDPYNLFNMLGEGEKRTENMYKIRNRTLRFLLQNQPDVDQIIARVLITYCFVSREDRKRVLLTWLSGQDIDEEEAKDIGLPTSWVKLDESSSEIGAQQQREEFALRAIRTIGILSTYYQPLILAFDQLEGLRDQRRLTERWGDTVREIFTMTPNFLIITCIFPSLWESWFSKELDRAVSERVAQQTVNLESFGPQHGLKMLATHLGPAFAKHRLPTNIYPFTETDVTNLCLQATSPRSFLQAARSLFQSWLDGESPAPEVQTSSAPVIVVTQEAIDTLLRSTLLAYESDQRRAYDSEIPMEAEFFGRVRNITETLLKYSEDKVTFGKATCGNRVMPPNFVLKPPTSESPLCIAVLFSEGSAFAARMRNLNSEMRSGKDFKHAVILRDRRCKQINGKASQQYIAEFEQMGGAYLNVGSDEICALNAVYDALVAIEEHDLSLGKHEIDKKQFVQFLRSEGSCRRTQLFRAAASRFPCVARAVGISSEPAPAKLTPRPSPDQSRKTVPPVKTERAPANPAQAIPARPAIPVQVLLGDTVVDSAHVGLVGRLKDDRRLVGVSFVKPQCLVLLGYMGSGKSYALGVLIENALLSLPNLSAHRQPLSVVAFNYRRNPDARFEYWGFMQPNGKSAEVAKLRSEYQGEPASIRRINVFGYGPELLRRQDEYRGIRTFPILFRPDELGAEHWQILMKPPTPQAEYMDVVRDIILKLFYREQLTFKKLEQCILTDERLTALQRRKAENRLSFARKWLSDEREYEWADILAAGTLNVFDLRMQTMTSDEALKLCLVITDLVRRAKNGVNKVVVFDEAHEYVDSKELVRELENAITQIRHDGLSFILASQFPERIPATIFKYLLTRFIFKLPSLQAINYVRKAASNLDFLSPQRVSNLDLEQGVCFVQTDADCTDSSLKVPQLLEIRPRCTQHGGETLRSTRDQKQEA